ncbi:hypothetical protein ACFLTE_08920 [Bacteroidota bacterium]
MKKIVGTVQPKTEDISYFVSWNENDRIVYLSPNITGPWIEIENDVGFESVAMVFAQNYVNKRHKQLQGQD